MKRSRSSSDLGDDGSEPEIKTRNHRVTLFDAVAGRVTDNGLKKQQVPLGKHSDHLRHTGTLRPDEVLYQGKSAPTRFAETDPYFAHRDLPSQLALPDSDLLSSIHAYVSQYCATMPRIDRDRAWRSMDETALLAMGVLIEEAVREALGKTGDLAFVEGEINDGPSADTTEVRDGRSGGRSDTGV